MVLSVGSEWMNVALLRTKADYSQERGINENSVTNGDLSQVPTWPTSKPNKTYLKQV